MRSEPDPSVPPDEPTAPGGTPVARTGASKPGAAPPPADLHVHVVAPVGRLRMRACIVHGFAEHAGRYLALARDLAEVGAEVHLMDAHGHGRSPGVRGLIPSEDSAVGAVVRLLENVQEDGVPVALFGHSFGGALALRAAQLRPDLLDAVVTTGPFLVSARPDPAWLVRGVRWGSHVLPRLRSLAIDAETVSNLPAEVKAYEDDPLVDRGGVRLGSARVLIDIGPRVLADAQRLVTPTLLLHGTRDRLADPEGTRQLYVKAGGRDVEVREIPGDGHALLHDANADRVRAGIVTWLLERLGLAGGEERRSSDLGPEGATNGALP